MDTPAVRAPVQRGTVHVWLLPAGRYTAALAQKLPTPREYRGVTQAFADRQVLLLSTSPAAATHGHGHSWHSTRHMQLCQAMQDSPAPPLPQQTEQTASASIPCSPALQRRR